MDAFVSTAAGRIDNCSNADTVTFFEYVEPTMSAHEDFHREEVQRLPSNRSFGIIFAVVFLVIGAAPAVRRHEVRWWALAFSLGFLVLGAMQSPLLTPLNRLWMRFASFLHRLISPVILGLVFATTVIPVGLILRWLGKDPMKRRWEAQMPSYWIPRTPPGPAPESMKNQF